MTNERENMEQEQAVEFLSPREAQVLAATALGRLAELLRADPVWASTEINDLPGLITALSLAADRD